MRERSTATIAPCMDAERILRGEACSNCALLGRRSAAGEPFVKSFRLCCEAGLQAHWTEADDWCVFWRAEEAP